MASAAAWQELRRKRCTARLIGGFDNNCDDNDAQHDRASHGQRGRDVLIPPERQQEIASQACDAQPDPKRLSFAAVEKILQTRWSCYMYQH
jgi:hypothetical protein